MARRRRRGGWIQGLQLLALCAVAWLCIGVARADIAQSHAYAQFGDIKYPAGFPHFEFVNPDAPKGGDIVLAPPLRLTTFDKYNPFTLKGTAPPGLSSLLFDTLLTGTFDETTTAYGLLAERVEVAPDRLSVTFHLRPQARFHNGDPVLARDVKHSFDTLISRQAAPQYRIFFGDVERAEEVGERSVRFHFKHANRELPLIVGGLPVFSHRWGDGKPFDQIVLEHPIASGPYRIGRVNFGRDITYQRDPAYWARDLNVRRGMYNFDRVTYKIYRDNTAQLEALKAGEFDYMQAFIAREWARSYTGRRFESGELVKKELEHGNAGDFQGFVINTRRAKFQDVRVRKAIELAMDFEWMNRQLFYDAYTRIRGYFTASDFEAQGLPEGEELDLLRRLGERFPDAMDPAVFTQPVPQPPSTAPPGSLRQNLRQAKALLEQAGWTYRDGALRNAQGEAFTIEFLDSGGGMSRILTPYIHALEKLGIRATHRLVDFALLQRRMDVFDFDMTSIRTIGSEAPGAELLARFSSAAADEEGSSNLMGVKDPVVDALLERAVRAETRLELATALRALDRVLRHGHYFVAHWYSGIHRIAYRQARFEQPKVAPVYYQPDTWILSTWWGSASNR